MLQIELNMYQAVAVAALVLLLGRFLLSKIPFLTKYCIPEPRSEEHTSELQSR